MKRSFNDKVWVITGASGNLGQTISRQMGKLGCKIFLLVASIFSTIVRKRNA